MRLNGLVKEGFALDDFVVLVASSGFTEDTVGHTHYASVLPGEHGIAWHRTLGLLELHAAMMRKEATSD